MKVKTLACFVCVCAFMTSCAVKQSGSDESSGSENFTESAEITTNGNVPAVSDTEAETGSSTDMQEETVGTAAADIPPNTDAPAVFPDPVTSDNPPDVIQSGVSPAGFKIEIIDGVTYVGGVLIANKTYALPEDYYTGGLTPETDAAFAELRSAAARDGISLWCKSGFRSYIDQRIIYNDYVARDGQKLADTYSARPGHSEHQSGMAIDVNSLYSSFGETAEGKWLAEHCWEYGFIIRYPADKVDVTGYMYEPWHIRYVGKDLALKIRESGLCLEEYLGITSIYSSN